MRVRAPDSMISSNLAIDPVLDLSLSSLADTPYSMELNLFKTLDDLINIWCQRRALRPLAYLLPAYPGVLAHTDQQFQLLEALKNLKRLCLDHLTPEELLLVTQVHDFLDRRLRTCVI
jgi:hypothetical protein